MVQKRNGRAPWVHRAAPILFRGMVIGLPSLVARKRRALPGAMDARLLLQMRTSRYPAPTCLDAQQRCSLVA